MTWQRCASAETCLTLTMRGLYAWFVCVEVLLYSGITKFEISTLKFCKLVCTDVEIEPAFQEVTGEVLPRGANKAPDEWVDIQARGF